MNINLGEYNEALDYENIKVTWTEHFVDEKTGICKKRQIELPVIIKRPKRKTKKCNVS